MAWAKSQSVEIARRRLEAGRRGLAPRSTEQTVVASPMPIFRASDDDIILHSFADACATSACGGRGFRHIEQQSIR